MYTIPPRVIRKIISRPEQNLKTCPTTGNAQYAGPARTSSVKKTDHLQARPLQWAGLALGIPMKPGSIRILRRKISTILMAEDWEKQWNAFKVEHPTSKLISPLFSALFSLREEEHWHAVTCMGDVVYDLAVQNMESARIVLRRLMWSLNDESGGIGWGAPEAMGEITAKHKDLALEYGSILISFVLPSHGPDNYLEYAPLRQGAYWGVARLAQSRPHLVLPYQEDLERALDREHDPKTQLLICLGLAHCASPPLASEAKLRTLAAQSQLVRIYWEESFQDLDLATWAHKLLLNVP